MKDYFNLRKSKLLLLTLLALCSGGVSPAWAETMTETFDDITVTSRYLLSNGWVMVHNNGNYQGFGGSYDYQIKSGNHDGETGNSLSCDYSDNNEYVVIPTKLTGTFTYYAKRSSSSNGTITFFEATRDGDNFTVTSTQLATTSTGSSWDKKSFELGEEGKYVAIRLLKSRIDQISATIYEEANGPALAVKDGSSKLTSPYSYSFGLATEGTTKTFTLSNPGTADLSITVSETGNFGATLSANTITAGGEVMLTLTMPATTGSSQVTITPADGSGIDPFVINVSGTIRDANKYYESGFTALPENWTTTGFWYYSADNGAYTTAWYLSSDARLITPLLTIGEGETFFVEAKGYSTSNTSYQHLQMQYSADGTTWTNFDSEPAIDPSNWQTFSFTGVPAGKYYIAINASQADVRMFYGGELIKAPKMVVTQPASLDYGIITSVTDKTFTIANTGKAELKGISITSSNSSIFSITGAPTTLAAGASAEVTITMSTTTAGVLSSEITVSATDMDDVKFTVSGVVMPEGATVVDFNDNKLPKGWGNDASYKWSFEDGKAYCTNAAELTTSKLEFADGDFFIVNATSYDNYDNNYLEVYVSEDGTNWGTTPIKKFISRSQIPYGSYASLVVTNIPTTTKHIKFKGYYVRIDEIVGLKFAAEDPRLTITEDAEGNNVVTESTVCDLGWVTSDASATYYIKNSGTGTLTIETITAPTGITATTLGNATTVAADATLALTVNMAVADNEGLHSGNIVITTNGGTFTIPVSGVVRNADKFYLDFSVDGTEFPVGWSTGNWTISNGVAKANGTLETTKFIAAEGDEMVFEAISTGSWSSTASLSYSYSVNGESWSDDITLTEQLNTSTYMKIALNDFATEDNDTVLIRFKGSNVSVRRIYGFTAAKVAVMTTTATNITFGMQTAESAEQTFTISNEGEAVLEGLSVTLGKTDDDAEYSIRMTDSEDAAFNGTTLAVGQTVTMHVKQLFSLDNLGAKSDILTIAATDQTSVSINLTGTTRDPSRLYVDFDEPNAFPDGWQTGADWSVVTTGSDRYAFQGNSKTPSALITTPLTVAEGETLTFKVARNGSGYGYTTSLKIRYSKNGGATWSDYVEYYNSDEAGSGYTSKAVENLPAGNIILEFFGNNIKLDMIQGLSLTTAPALALIENDAFVENESTKDFENLSADGVATYTLKNIGNAPLTSTLTGNGVTVSPTNVTLAAGESAEITVTMTYTTPYGAKNGSMTIDSEGWIGDMTVNYTANLVDPTVFLEDFSGNTKPNGWYDDGWTYTNDIAYVYTGTAKAMITEKVGAESGKNTLTFDAKVYTGEDEQTLTVFTSADRYTWSDGTIFTLTAASQSFNLNLADGSYYVKFEASNAIVDNVTGLKKIEAPAHDLFVPATAVTLSGTQVTATATVASLSAEENGVYAQLVIDDKVKVTTEPQTISANGSKTFNMNYTVIPGAHTAQVVVFDGNNKQLFASAETELNVKCMLYETQAPGELAAVTCDVSLQRTFVAGWNTVCLPFELEVSDIHAEAVAFSFDAYNTETKKLTFNKVINEPLQAGKPYVIYVPSAINTTMNFTNVSITATEASASSYNGVAFQGTYAPMAAGSLTDCYGLTKEGRIAKASANATMKGFRGYFTGVPADARVVFSGDDDTQGIRSIIVDTAAPEGTYNMQGQKVEQLKKGGLYIINGKKQIVK